MFRNFLPFLVVLPATIYSLLSLWCGWRFFKGQGPRAKGQKISAVTGPRTLDPGPCCGVTILKPVKGIDEGSFDNFASFCCQQYDGPVQILFAVAAEDDPVIPVIRQLQDDFPDRDIRLNIDPAIHGPNLKISNLMNIFPLARYDLLLICDSDIRVEPTFLASVTAHFSNPRTGLVTSPYRTCQVHGTATALEALGFTAEMVPNVVVALQLEGLSFALGAAMTFRRQALEEIGGLGSLVDYLADDYQLGNKIHRAGWELVLDRQFVESMVHAENIRGILSRQLRWARTMRVSRPGGYLASGVTLPGLAVLIVLAAGPLPWSLAAILLLYVVRSAVVTLFSRSLLKDRLLPKWGWLLPLRDLLASATWLCAFLGNSVQWRGQRFRVLDNGKLEIIKK